ncbi:MAG: hypothetical protein PHP43_00600 [Methanoculleus sp.]|nr:hypothetical protein [Methanoculleus sp.]
MKASQIVLAAAAVLVLALLAGEAVDPILYTATNVSTAAHADPATVKDRSPGNAAALVPLMDELLGESGTLALTIKLKDYESAERDLARYSDLSRQFDRLVVTLDVSGTDIGEFQRNNHQNQDALTTLLNDTRRFEDLKRLEIEVEGDEGERMAIAYEGEALRQKMREGFASYAKREVATVRIAEHYGANATPYRESVGHFAEVADAADAPQTGGGSGGTTAPRSPLTITVTPETGRYGETLSITGAYAGGTPGAPIEIYVDSRSAATLALNDNRTYTHPYRIDRILAGSHLAYAVAGAVYSEVATFEVLPTETTITLDVAEVNTTAVACTGNLTTTEGRAVTNAPVLVRVDGDTLVAGETDQNGTYSLGVVLPAGEHTLKAEFHAAGYPLNTSESETATIAVHGEGLSPLPFIAALAAAAATGWYFHRRRPEESVPAPEPAVTPETGETEPEASIEGLPPREAATVLFYALRSRLGIPASKTPRDCALLAPVHAGFFERYERIRYAGEVPTEEELRAMEAEARGGDEGAA